jgi:hypothetical protein
LCGWPSYQFISRNDRPITRLLYTYVYVTATLAIGPQNIPLFRIQPDEPESQSFYYICLHSPSDTIGRLVTTSEASPSLPLPSALRTTQSTKHTPNMPTNLSLICMSIVLAATSAQRTCYFRDGTEAVLDTPCNADDSEESMCCGAGNLCFSNGLCFDPAVMGLNRGSCTDSTWNIGICRDLSGLCPDSELSQFS